ncbi:MAG: hypothetical protein IT435_19585 [Phycisphaerales bacterium]|nr:hypothetical protein [Phycisphaerales bacterium]
MNRMHTNALAAGVAVIAAMAGSAGAAVGNIVYTTGNMGIKYYNNGAISTLYNIPASASEGLGGIDRGPNGEFYVTAGQYPVDLNNNKSAIYRVDNLFTVPSHSVVKQGFPLANPTTLKYNFNNNKLLTVQSPQSEYNPVNPVRGLVSVDAVTGNVVTSFNQNNSNPPPQPFTANDIVNSPYAANQYLVACNNGGDSDFSFPDSSASTLWKFDYDTGTEISTPTLLVNFADLVATGLGSKLSFVRTVDIKPSTNEVFFVDAKTGVYKAQLDGSGNWINGSVQLLLAQDNTDFVHLGGAKWNPYTDKLVFTVESSKAFYQMNTDGSGLELLAGPGEDVFGVYFIPSPGAAGLAGLAGLMITRRRR